MCWIWLFPTGMKGKVILRDYAYFLVAQIRSSQVILGAVWQQLLLWRQGFLTGTASPSTSVRPSSTETAGPGRDAQGRVTVKSPGRRHSPGPPVQPSHLLHLTLCRFWPARSRFHYPANGDSNSLAQSVGDKLSWCTQSPARAERCISFTGAGPATQ